MTMDNWYSAAELAGLPGLPGTEHEVKLLAKREGWEFRRRAGRSGGREHPIDALPVITRGALVGIDLASSFVSKRPSSRDEHFSSLIASLDTDNAINAYRLLFGPAREHLEWAREQFALLDRLEHKAPQSIREADHD